MKEEMRLNKDFGFYLSLPSEFLAAEQRQYDHYMYGV